MTMQLVTRIWSALTKSVGLRCFQTAYSSYFIHDTSTALFHTVLLLIDDHPPLSRRTSLDGAGYPVKTEAQDNEAAQKRSVAVYHAMRLLTLELFSYLHNMLCNNSFYNLDNDKLLSWNAVKLPQSTAPALSFVFASLSDEAVQPLYKRAPAGKRTVVIELDNEKNVRSPAATAAGEDPCAENHRRFVYRAEAPPSSFVHSFPAKKRKPLLSVMTTGL